MEAGLQLQTLFYRAPEILFGDVGFGLAVDFWSLGIMMAELAGFAFSRDNQKAGHCGLLTGRPCSNRWGHQRLSL